MKRCWPWRHEWVELKRWEMMFYPHLFTDVKKPLEWCVNSCKNDDGSRKPVQRPSWVLCINCLAGLSKKMHSLKDELWPSQETKDDPPR